MKANVIEEKCIGCELCVSTCPEVFRMNDKNIAETLPGDVSESAQNSCREAAKDCPVEAIEIK
jgi:ferredoxin